MCWFRNGVILLVALRSCRHRDHSELFTGFKCVLADSGIVIVGFQQNLSKQLERSNSLDRTAESSSIQGYQQTIAELFGLDILFLCVRILWTKLVPVGGGVVYFQRGSKLKIPIGRVYELIVVASRFGKVSVVQV